MKKPRTAQQVLAAILARTKPGPGGCVLYTGARDKAGYGRVGGPHPHAHRAVWLLAQRAIPAGLELDHICRQRACVNLDHLRAVTHAENMRNRLDPRGGSSVRCYLGHPKTLTSGGAPVCRTCRMDGLRRWRRNHPAEARAVYRASKAAERRRQGVPIRPRPAA